MVGTSTFDFSEQVAIVTGGGGALGSAVARSFADAGAQVAAIDIVDPDDEDALLEVGDGVTYYQADLTDESAVQSTVGEIVTDHGRVDALANIAGTWRGGSPLHETDESTFDLLVDVNLRTMFLTTKHAMPHLVESEGAVVSVSARSSLEGGSGDGIYRATKAGIRLLTESIAKEQLGTVRANAVMPSVLDTPMNREMMEPSDDWVDPSDVAAVILFLCSDAASVTSGAAVPVYGEA
ncbi:MAG: SDR family oxidoreductase [Halobacteriota archaeon]